MNAMQQNDCECSFGCSVEAAAEVIGGKWKGVILHHLKDHTKRFNELKKQIPNITQRMLTRQLRELERDTIVKRHAYAELPPRVEYSLTAFGKSLLPILNELDKWGSEYINQLDDIRKKQTTMINIDCLKTY